MNKGYGWKLEAYLTYDPWEQGMFETNILHCPKCGYIELHTSELEEKDEK